MGYHNCLALEYTPHFTTRDHRCFTRVCQNNITGQRIKDVYMFLAKQYTSHFDSRDQRGIATAWLIEYILLHSPRYQRGILIILLMSIHTSQLRGSNKYIIYLDIKYIPHYGSKDPKVITIVWLKGIPPSWLKGSMGYHNCLVHEQTWNYRSGVQQPIYQLYG